MIWRFDEGEYNRQLWEKVREKCGGKARVLSTDTDISPAQAARYLKNDSLGDLQADTRQLFLTYTGYNNFDVFRQAMDKEVLTATIAEPEDASAGTFLHSKFHINMPARPELFLGRGALLREIHDRLTDRRQRDNVLLLTSMGGMGKTTLLHEYLNRDLCRKHFKWIISVSVHRNLEYAFVQAVADALQLDLSTVFAREKRLDMVIQAMQQQDGDNLVAIDNINEADYDELVSMYRHFRRTGWKILITTRTNPDGMEYIDVRELDLKDAMLLFLHYYVPDMTNREEALLLQYMQERQLRPDLEKLLHHIRCHTLFTELLAKTGYKTRATPQQLLEHLKAADLRHPALDRPVNTGAHPFHTSNSLSKATLHQYMLSIFDTEYLLAATADEAVAAENRQRVTMLQFFSVLPSVEIPINHLKTLWRVNEQQANDFEDRLDILKQTGWIKGEYAGKQGLTYKMHHLIQEVVAEKLKPTMKSCAPLVKSLTEIMRDRRAMSDSEFTAYKKYLRAASRKLPELLIHKK